MRARKRVLVSLFALLFGTVAVTGITVGVMVGLNQNLKDFTVKYDAANIAATVSARYQVVNFENATYFTGGNVTYDGVSNAGWKFAPADLGDTTVVLTTSSSNVSLSAVNNYVIFTYIFQNDVTSQTGAKYMKVTLSDDSVKTNVNCYYYVSDQDFETYSTIKGVNTENDQENVSVPSAQDVAPGETIYFHVLIEIADDTLGASYVSTYDDSKTPVITSGVSWSLEISNKIVE